MIRKIIDWFTTGRDMTTQTEKIDWIDSLAEEIEARRKARVGSIQGQKTLAFTVYLARFETVVLRVIYMPMFHHNRYLMQWQAGFVWYTLSRTHTLGGAFAHMARARESMDQTPANPTWDWKVFQRSDIFYAEYYWLIGLPSAMSLAVSFWGKKKSEGLLPDKSAPALGGGKTLDVIANDVSPTACQGPQDNPSPTESSGLGLGGAVVQGMDTVCLP